MRSPHINSFTPSAVAAAYLVATAPGLDRQHVLRASAVTTIGRDPSNLVVLHDEFCSRRHCKITYNGREWLLFDNGSKNGTRVNGELIDGPYRLQPEDEIQIGRATLTFYDDLATRSPDDTQNLTEHEIAELGSSVYAPPDSHETPAPEAASPAPPSSETSSSEESTAAIQRRPRRSRRTSPTGSNAPELIGDSASMRALREHIRRVAPTGATALIRGESGVGKELVAAAIHAMSPRHDGPFVCLNCAALSESLLESELLGHERGSFTGATEQKKGKFELADGGTLFLDEVGEMSPAIQAKFLRVLEGHPFERVGGGSPVHANVRVVAATNRNLESAVRSGEFRKDLYYRLMVVQILVDPLRDRRGDIAQLVDFFLDRFARKNAQPRLQISEAAIERLQSYHWPGNVRELQNTIERAAILCQTGTITLDDIELAPVAEEESTPGHPDAGYLPQSLEQVELSHILATLESTNWNKSRAAEILGIERSTLDRKLKRNNVQKRWQTSFDKPV
ncbi:sigma 54-interacting transcriptional regulator [Maioricimonas sp. JC845]|uniref:sigma 54-interacting transcriptional regulator n=1 Tax=Maioricimonas sp. JC845 TaxID=3232138 RepID=UPI003459470F